jgi:hypothetical protein
MSKEQVSARLQAVSARARAVAESSFPFADRMEGLYQIRFLDSPKVYC